MHAPGTSGRRGKQKGDRTLLEAACLPVLLFPECTSIIAYDVQRIRDYERLSEVGYLIECAIVAVNNLVNTRYGIVTADNLRVADLQCPARLVDTTVDD